MANTKTTVSIEEEIFKESEELAEALNMKRGQYYSTALKFYNDYLKQNVITENLNKIYEKCDSKPEEGLAALQFRSISKEEW